MSDLRTINFKNWTFDVDQLLTKTLYSNIMWGRADAIPKNEFKTYAAQREDLFPQEVLDLFAALGIDYRKELKIDHQLDEEGFNIYEGTFYAVGDLSNGRSCKVDLSRDLFIYELTPLDEYFSIGFYQEQGGILNQHLIYVVFTIAIPCNVGVRVRAS